jgi:hypothetical protein
MWTPDFQEKNRRLLIQLKREKWKEKRKHKCI